VKVRKKVEGGVVTGKLCKQKRMAVEEGLDDQYTQDGTVDLKGNPVRRSKSGGWTACSFVVGTLSLCLSLFLFIYIFLALRIYIHVLLC
jgi:hypothetical protein